MCMYIDIYIYIDICCVFDCVQELQFENDFAQMVLASINEAKTGRRVGGEVTKIPQSILKEALTSPFTTTPGTSKFSSGGEQLSSRGGIGEVGQSGLSPEKGTDGEGGGDVSVNADELTDSPTEEGEGKVASHGYLDAKRTAIHTSFHLGCASLLF